MQKIMGMVLVGVLFVSLSGAEEGKKEVKKREVKKEDKKEDSNPESSFKSWWNDSKIKTLRENRTDNYEELFNKISQLPTEGTAEKSLNKSDALKLLAKKYPDIFFHYFTKARSGDAKSIIDALCKDSTINPGGLADTYFDILSARIKNTDKKNNNKSAQEAEQKILFATGKTGNINKNCYTSAFADKAKDFSKDNRCTAVGGGDFEPRSLPDCPGLEICIGYVDCKSIGIQEPISAVCQARDGKCPGVEACMLDDRFKVASFDPDNNQRVLRIKKTKIDDSASGRGAQ